MSMGMLDSGHIVHATAMLREKYHLAWGRLPEEYVAPWNLGDIPPPPLSEVRTKTLVKGATQGSDAIGDTNILDLVRVTFNGVDYAVDEDVKLDANKVKWTNPTNEVETGSSYQIVYRVNTAAMNRLLDEIGRRSPSMQTYCKPDENGDIVANDSSWSVSTEPTRFIYLQFKFDSTDAIGSIIHQMGLFTGTEMAEGVPVGKKYLNPDEVADSGHLYMIENIEPFSRFAGKREIFEYVLTF